MNSLYYDFNYELDDSFSHLDGMALMKKFIKDFASASISVPSSNLADLITEIKKYVKPSKIGISFKFQDNEFFKANMIRIIVPRIFYALDLLIYDAVEKNQFLTNNFYFLNALIAFSERSILGPVFECFPSLY